jgi:hypothetical protein
MCFSMPSVFDSDVVCDYSLSAPDRTDRRSVFLRVYVALPTENDRARLRKIDEAANWNWKRGDVYITLDRQCEHACPMCQRARTAIWLMGMWHQQHYQQQQQQQLILQL